MLGNYQIALIVLLLLNFVFWILIMCWRVFINRSTFRQPPAQRNRLNRTGIDNPAIDEADGNDLPSYISIVGDLEAEPPPPYDEVTKSTNPAPPYTREANTRPKTGLAVSDNVPSCGGSSRGVTRISEDQNPSQLVFYDGKGNAVNIYTIPVEVPCYLVFDEDRALKANQANA